MTDTCGKATYSTAAEAHEAALAGAAHFAIAAGIVTGAAMRGVLVGVDAEVSALGAVADAFEAALLR